MINAFRMSLVLVVLVLLLANYFIVPEGRTQEPEKGKAEKVQDGKTGATTKEADETTAAKQKEAEKETFVSLVTKSGWSGMAFMIVLGLFSLIAVAITIERFVNLRRGTVIPWDISRRLQGFISAKDSNYTHYQKLVESDPSPFAKVLKSGLARLGRPIPEVEKTMEDALAREVSRLRGSARPLTIVGNVAPLVGLLGTVVGMIMAFRAASQEGLGGDAQILVEGIYLALLTTAAGLTIAIPSMLFAALFNSRIDHYLREMDERLMETIPCFEWMEDSDTGSSEKELVGAGGTGYVSN